MASHGLGAFIQHESPPPDVLATLTPVLHRDTTFSARPSVVEMDELQWGHQLNGPRKSGTPAVGDEDPIIPTPSELEHTLSAPPQSQSAVGMLVQSATNPPKNPWRLASTGLMFLLFGLTDAVVSG
jgi:hypothetical protein